MADSFLSPGGDYADVGSFCGVRDPNTNLDFMRAVDAAASEVRQRCGPVLLEQGLTYESPGWVRTLVLPFRVAAVESIVTDDGATLTVADFRAPAHHLGGHGGQLVVRRDGGQIPPCTVTYSSGWAHGAYPATLVGAGFEVARHLWRTQLGNQRTGDEQGGAWLWPRQAEQLAADWMLAPLGFA